MQYNAIQYNSPVFWKGGVNSVITIFQIQEDSKLTSYKTDHISWLHIIERALFLPYIFLFYFLKPIKPKVKNCQDYTGWQ